MSFVLLHNFKHQYICINQLEIQFWVPILKAIGNTEKSNMKTGKNVDPLKKKIFERRLLGNLTTNS